jgi:pimeloyl-ACP methyl ester carboxylesterase
MPQVTINNTHCYYSLAACSGIPAGTLVLLHGSGGDGSVWENQAADLSRSLRVVIPDLPGHGRSGGAALSVPAAAEWLKQLSISLDLAPFFLVGHSLGGAIAQEFARIHPQTLRGLVLAGTGMRLPVPPEYLQLVKDDVAAAIEVSCARAYAPGVAPELVSRGRGMLQRNGQAALYNDLTACAAFDSSAWIGSVELPALVICGRDDRIVDCGLAREIAHSLPRGSLHLVPGAGHMLMHEAPEEFNAALQHFIRACPA